MNETLQMIMGGIIIAIGFASVIAYPVLQYGALRQMRGVWLAFCLAPLVIMAAVIAFTAFALSQASNLWPLLLIFASPVATVYLLVLRFAERQMGGARN
jgi:hypothetical protein